MRRKLPKKLSPVEWGLPPRFESWRPGQFEAVMDAVYEEKRFDIQSAPTGSGKTLRYVAAAHFLGGRTAILTATKGLQKQLMEEFGDHMAFVNISGKANYHCPNHGNCQKGHIAGCQNANTDRCEYSRAEQDALASRFVLTNYTYWILKHRYAGGLGKFDMLVLDEAHFAPDQLAKTLHVGIRHDDLYDILTLDAPKRTNSPDSWRIWSRDFALPRSLYLLEETRLRLQSVAPPPHLFTRFLKLRELSRKMTVLADIDPMEWVVDMTGNGWTIDPVNPGKYAENYLFFGVPKILMVSATVRPKTLEFLGIRKKGPGAERHNRRTYAFQESPSTFDPKRHPLIYVPTQKVDHSQTSLKEWVTRHDQIIKPRRDRKGIVHTGSYQRRDALIDNSRQYDIFISNFKGDVTAEIVSDFKECEGGAVLVSPSVVAGYNFPYSACEYQIIGKVPFPDSRSKVVRARQEIDKEYGAYVAIQQLQQACGRGMRAADDRCENYIIDDHFKWFYERYWKLFTPDFRKTVKMQRVLPPPPPKLEK